MLKSRLITSALLIPAIILLIWFLPPLYYALVSALIIAIGAWEWSGLIGYRLQSLRILYVITILIGLLIVNWLPALPLLVIGALILIWAFFAVLRYQLKNHALGFQYPQLKILIGMFLLIPFWIGLLVLKIQGGPQWVLLVLLIVWTADSAAYFAGRRFGKHRLIPKVSPNKTWEGLWAGLIAGLLVCIIYSFFMRLAADQRLFLWALASITILFSMVGDLMVSLLKRLIGIKDTGSLLPGHGGILDRVDSLIAGVIIFSLGLLVIPF